VYLLPPDDVSPETGRAVPRQMPETRLPCGRDSQIFVEETKTRRSRRRIALSPMAVEALQKHRLRQKEERLGAGSCWYDNDYLFPNTIGKLLEPSHMRQPWFDKMFAQAGLSHIRFHDTRHTAATLLLLQGGISQSREYDVRSFPNISRFMRLTRVLLAVAGPAATSSSAEAYVGLLHTDSLVLSLDASAREGFLHDMGLLIDSHYDGHVSRNFVYEVIAARKRLAPEDEQDQP
jgi:hypothetical protein